MTNPLEPGAASARPAEALAEKRRIVCGTDFSLQAAEAGDVAAALAAALDEVLFLVHVIPHSNLDEPMAALPDSAVEPAQKKLDAEADRLRALGATVKAELLTGPASEAITAFAKIHRTRLIVLSSVGKIAPSKWLLGSVAERTAESATVPTLVVRFPHPMTAWARGEKALNLFVAVDLSRSSEAALEFARELSAIRPCAITVGHIAWPPQEQARLGIKIENPFGGLPEEMRASIEGDLRAKVRESLGDHPVKILVEPAWGSTEAHLLELAGPTKPDLIVVGTRRRQGLRHLWNASVSRGMLQHAETNVGCAPTAILAKPGGKPFREFKKALVTTDFSEIGNAAIPFAYSLVNPGGAVCLMHVAEAEAGAPPLDRADPRRLEIRDRLWQLVPVNARERGIETTIEVAQHKRAATAICQAAERLGCEAICIGSHGRTSLLNTIMGSVAQSVLAESNKPVLVVRARED